MSAPPWTSPFVVIVVVSPQLLSPPPPTMREDQVLPCVVFATKSAMRTLHAVVTHAFSTKEGHGRARCWKRGGKTCTQPCGSSSEETRQGVEHDISHESRTKRHEGDKGRIAEDRCRVGMGGSHADRSTHDRGDADATLGLTKLAIVALCLFAHPTHATP